MKTSEYTYFAFISYKREDERWAKWIQNELESYTIPSTIRKANRALPSKIRPVFRDKSDLAGGKLSHEIEKNLNSSRYLILVCSPRSAHSIWVEKEAEYFIRNGRSSNIIPFIIEGMPNAQNAEDECFPASLRNLSGDSELLGINIHELGREAALIKVIARMFEVRFDVLWQRYNRKKENERRLEKKRQNRLLEMQSRMVSEKCLHLIQEGDSYLASRICLELLKNDYVVSRRILSDETESVLRKSSKLRNCIFEGHQKSCMSMSVCNQSDCLISGGLDETVRIWDINTGILLNTIELGDEIIPNEISISPDGQLFLVTSSEGFGIWQIDGTAKVFWFESRVAIHSGCFLDNNTILLGLSHALQTLSLNSKQSEIYYLPEEFSCNDKLYLYGDKFILYNKSNECLTIYRKQGEKLEETQRIEDIKYVDFDKESGLLLCIREEGNVQIWLISDEAAAMMEFQWQEANVEWAFFYGDAEKIVVGISHGVRLVTIKIIDFVLTKEIYELNCENRRGMFGCAYYNRPAKLLYLNDEESSGIFQIDLRPERFGLDRINPTDLKSFAIDTFVIDNDGVIYAMSHLKDDKRKRFLLKFSLGGSLEKAISMGNINPVRLSKEHNLLLIEDWDNTFVVYDCKDMSEQQIYCEEADGYSRSCLGGDGDNIYICRFTDAVMKVEKKNIKTDNNIWQCEIQIGDQVPFSIANPIVSPNNRVLVVPFSKTLYFINTVDGVLLSNITLANPANSISFRRDSRHIAIFTDKSEVLVYDLRLCKIIRSVQLRSIFNPHLEYSRDGKYIIATSDYKWTVMTARSLVIVDEYESYSLGTVIKSSLYKDNIVSLNDRGEMYVSTFETMDKLVSQTKCRFSGMSLDDLTQVRYYLK